SERHDRDDEDDVEQVAAHDGPGSPVRGRVRRASRTASVGNSRTSFLSHGCSKPPRANNRSTSPAVKPQTMSSRTPNAGPIQPLGWFTRNRFAGSASSASG